MKYYEITDTDGYVFVVRTHLEKYDKTILEAVQNRQSVKGVLVFDTGHRGNRGWYCDEITKQEFTSSYGELSWCPWAKVVKEVNNEDIHSQERSDVLVA